MRLFPWHWRALGVHSRDAPYRPGGKFPNPPLPIVHVRRNGESRFHRFVAVNVLHIQIGLFDLCFHPAMVAENNPRSGDVRISVTSISTQVDTLHRDSFILSTNVSVLRRFYYIYRCGSDLVVLGNSRIFRIIEDTGYTKWIF